MNIQSVVLTSSSATSDTLVVDLGRFRNGAGLLCTLDEGATAVYNVQVSGDNVHWNYHDTLHGKVISANGNLTFPVRFVRLIGTVADGVVTLVLIQAS